VCECSDYTDIRMIESLVARLARFVSDFMVCSMFLDHFERAIRPENIPS